MAVKLLVMSRPRTFTTSPGLGMLLSRTHITDLGSITERWVAVSVNKNGSDFERRCISLTLFRNLWQESSKPSKPPRPDGHMQNSQGKWAGACKPPPPRGWVIQDPGRMSAVGSEPRVTLGVRPCCGSRPTSVHPGHAGLESPSRIVVCGVWR